MQTDRIAVEVRPRAAFEAVDLGFRFARAVFWPLFPAHALVVAAVTLALYAGMPDRLWLAVLVLWWLKPLFDRIALAVLAEALFGRVPGLGETLASVPRLVATTGLVHSLSWLRFSPLRTFTAPVLQLEGLRGMERSRRASVLIGRDSRAALGLLFACGLFELVIVVAGLQFIASFQPEGAVSSLWLSALGVDGSDTSWSYALLYALAITAVEPFFVAGGFALYVNRRIWLEGWDIDLAFRKLERRVAHGSARGTSARSLASVGLAIALLVSAGARAEPEVGGEAPPACDALRPEGAVPCIDEILAGEEFATLERVELWLPKLGEPSDELEPGPLASFGLWLGSVAATFLRVGAWLAIGLIVGALALAIARSLRARDPAPSAALSGEPGVRVARDEPPAPLPSDVVAAARSRFEHGDAPGALSLLYRGALAHLVRGFGLEIPPSATEGECERIARGALDSPISGDFSALSRAWVHCAYARRSPSAPEFGEMCARWDAHLRGAT